MYQYSMCRMENSYYMKDLVSIIVPVYNVQKYLDKCIESMLKQTYTNIEIVLVDDGSTDGSASICDKYAADDERIVVVHKKNGGQSVQETSDLRKVQVNIYAGLMVTIA